MVYILYISVLHNKTKDRYIYGPQEIDNKYNNIKYWVLPKYTNDENYKDIIQELIIGLFKPGKTISIGKGFSNLYLIKDISWNKNLRKTVTKTFVKEIDNNPKTRKFKTNIYLYLTKNNKESFNDNCKYHKTFLKDIFSGNEYFNRYNYQKLNKEYLKKVFKYLSSKEKLNNKEKNILNKVSKILTYKERVELL
jgi:hypothetical protein